MIRFVHNCKRFPSLHQPGFHKEMHCGDRISVEAVNRQTSQYSDGEQGNTTHKALKAIITSSADLMEKKLMEGDSTDQTKLKSLFIETDLITLWLCGI